MKVEFLGMTETSSHGCSACGQKRKSKTEFVATKHYYLPSGADKYFHVGRPEEVTAQDGKFLLSYVETDANGTRHVFREVTE